MKYRVYAIATASWPIGEYEADSKEAAENLADADKDAAWGKGLCHQCAGEVELGDVCEIQIEELTA